MNSEDLAFVYSVCRKYFNPQFSSGSLEQFCVENHIFLCTKNWTYGDRRKAAWSFFGNLNRENSLTNLVLEHHGKLINHPTYIKIPRVLHPEERQGTPRIFRFAAVSCFQDKISESANFQRIKTASR